MRSHLYAAILLLLSPDVLFSQEKREIMAIRTPDAVQIDGKLSEPSWQSAPIATTFTDIKPVPHTLSVNQTRVRIMYDDEGIYIGAELDESSPNGPGKELTERDVLGDNRKIDWFGFVVDCYHNGLNGYGFVVTAAGSQTDIKLSVYGEDSSWDAVWDSEISFTPSGWICEMKIPYSALRFPEQDIQKWGVQFGRRSNQRQDESWWNELDPGIDGLLPQTGTLNGIEYIKPPLRLSATPFFAVYAENLSNIPGGDSWGTSYNGGMDIKYGISDAYTMDMTLIPDFGQVQSDNQVLNLSPFEVQFAENRQFFTEGTELFSKANLFYSRRVGGTPYYLFDIFRNLQEGESIAEIQTDSRLINATKISGRSKGGTGLGFFNATSPRDHAIIENSMTGQRREALLQPWTNYNVTVLDQNLKNNSNIALINTNVMREGGARDANVTGIDFEFRDKANVYGLAGGGSLSQLFLPGEVSLGHRYNLGFRRLSGNFNWGVSYYMESDTYNNNDLGFITSNNEQQWSAYAEYDIFEPFGPFQSAGGGINVRRGGLYRFPGAPDTQVRPNLFTDAGVDTWIYATFKNFWYLNVWHYFQPTPGYDYFEPRVAGRFFTYPAFKNVGLNFNTDRRKSWQLGGNMRLNKFHEKTKHQFQFGGFAQYRLNNHFTLGYDFGKLFMRLDRGFIGLDGDEIVMGARDYNDLTQLVYATYTFSPKLALTFRLRHNWTTVKYTNFYYLLDNGGLQEIEYNENEDINFNAWTIDMNLRWRFAPGSDVFVVWKNAIYGQDHLIDASYAQNLETLFRFPQSNSFSVKAIYYIDVAEW